MTDNFNDIRDALARMTPGDWGAIGYVLLAGDPTTQRQELAIMKLGYENAGNDIAGIVTLRNRIGDLLAALDALTAEIAALRAELDEQARVNGMGGEREAALLAEVERLKAAVAANSMKGLNND